MEGGLERPAPRRQLLTRRIKLPRLHRQKRLTPRQMLRLATQFAALSNDPRTQNGALLIKDGVPLTETASPNMPPAGVRLFGERLSNPTKRKVFECAERNAIYSAARLGIPTQGLTLVTPLVPCPHCARAIIQAGITELITLAKQPDSPAQRPATTALARAMLDEAGVKVTYYEGEIGGPTIRHDGEPFQP